MVLEALEALTSELYLNSFYPCQILHAAIFPKNCYTKTALTVLCNPSLWLPQAVAGHPEATKQNTEEGGQKS